MIIGRTRIELEPRLSPNKWLGLVVPVTSVFFALIVGGVFLLATGHSAFGTYSRLLSNGYTSFDGATRTIGFATPLICTGLAAAFAFRMNLFNIGGEGQMYLGMIGGTWAGIALADHLPKIVAIPLVLIVGSAAGAAMSENAASEKALKPNAMTQPP